LTDELHIKVPPALVPVNMRVKASGAGEFGSMSAVRCSHWLTALATNT
jgi:hypothetical protein